MTFFFLSTWLDHKVMGDFEHGQFSHNPANTVTSFQHATHLPGLVFTFCCTLKKLHFPLSSVTKNAI